MGDKSASGVRQCGPGVPPEQLDRGLSGPQESLYQTAMNTPRLGMLIFLGSETMLFGGFVAAFLVFRLGAPVWPPPLQPRLPVGVTGVNTGVLLLSGYTMWRALHAARAGNRAGAVKSLAQTGLLGATFLAVQGYEWARLLTFGLTASSGIYGGTFYTLIGAHAVHVLGALIWLALTLNGSSQSRYTARDQVRISLLGMYWLFVVGLWPILYLIVYLV